MIRTHSKQLHEGGRNIAIKVGKGVGDIGSFFTKCDISDGIEVIREVVEKLKTEGTGGVIGILKGKQRNNYSTKQRREEAERDREETFFTDPNSHNSLKVDSNLSKRAICMKKIDKRLTRDYSMLDAGDLVKICEHNVRPSYVRGTKGVWLQRLQVKWSKGYQQWFPLVDLLLVISPPLFFSGSLWFHRFRQFREI